MFNMSEEDTNNFWSAAIGILSLVLLLVQEVTNGKYAISVSTDMLDTVVKVAINLIFGLIAFGGFLIAFSFFSSDLKSARRKAVIAFVVSVICLAWSVNQSVQYHASTRHSVEMAAYAKTDEYKKAVELKAVYDKKVLANEILNQDQFSAQEAANTIVEKGSSTEYEVSMEDWVGSIVIYILTVISSGVFQIPARRSYTKREDGMVKDYRTGELRMRAKPGRKPKLVVNN